MPSIYTAALMEHNAHPDYKYDLENATHEHEGINPSCGDELVLKLRLGDDGRTIEEAAFTGHGCAVSQASADMMADLITGESIEEARRLCELFPSVRPPRLQTHATVPICLSDRKPSLYKNSMIHVIIVPIIMT